MVVCILYPGFKFLLVSPRSTVFSSVWPCQQSSWARNLSVIRPSSVCVAIISEPVEHIPFKFQLWLPLGLSEGGNGHFWKKITFSDCLWTFQLFVNIRPYGSQNFKALLLPQITFDFQTSTAFSSQCSSQKWCFGFLELWAYDISRFFFWFFFSFSLT